MAASWPAQTIRCAIVALKPFSFEERVGRAKVVMTRSGGRADYPWNSDAGFICSKLATAMASGCTAVIKPSEMTALADAGNTKRYMPPRFRRAC